MNLSISHPLPADYPPGQVALAALILTVITLVAVRQRTARPWLLLGWLWFLGTLAPVIGLVQVGSQALADRYTYLPAIGLFSAVVFTGADMVARQPKWLTAIRAFTGAVLIGCIAVTEHQLAFWKNTDTLFSHALAVTPNNAQAHMMLGIAAERRGADAAAIDRFEAALKIDPGLTTRKPDGAHPLAAQVALLRAEAAAHAGETTNAMALYRQALAGDPRLPEAHENLGVLLDEAGQSAEAILQYQAALQLAPEDPLAYENLGTALLNLGRFEDAKHQYELAAAIQPGNPLAAYLMAKAYLRHGQSAEAITSVRHALELDPNDLQSLALLARILATDENPAQRNGAEAATLAEKALNLAGADQPYFLDVLALADAETGRFANARQTATQALALAKADDLPELAAKINAHLTRYQAGQPCRETFTNTLPVPAR